MQDFTGDYPFGQMEFQTSVALQTLNMVPLGMVMAALLCQAHSQIFSLQPQDMVVYKGRDVTITCWSAQMTAHQSRNCTWPRLRWIKSSSTSEETERVVACYTVEDPFNQRMTTGLDENNEQYHLTIYNVKPQDSGEYFCRMYYPYRFASPVTHDSAKALLKVKRWSPPICQVVSQQLGVGATVVLKCSLSPDDLPGNITWFESPSTNQKRLQTLWLTQPRGQLSIRRILQEMDNMKTFMCVAGFNANGPNCSVTPLNIAPTVSISPSSLTLFEGETAMFTCNLTAISSAAPDKYVWFVTRGDRPTMRVDLTTLDNHRGLYSLSQNAKNLEILEVSSTDFNNTVINCSAFLGQTPYSGVSWLTVLRAPLTTVITTQAATETTATGTYKDNSETTTQTTSTGFIIGGALVIIVLVIIMVLLAQYLIRNMRKGGRQQRPGIQESSREDAAGGSLPLETNPTYENLSDVTRSPPEPASQATKETAGHREDLYAIPNKRRVDIRHFTMTPQTNKASAIPGFVSLPRNLEPVSSSGNKDQMREGTTYAKENKPGRIYPKPAPTKPHSDSSASVSDDIVEPGSQREIDELEYANLNLDHPPREGTDAIYAKPNKGDKGHSKTASTQDI